MGLMSAIAGLPFAPIRGVVRIAEVLQDEAEREFYDPRVIRRQLEELDDAWLAGQLTEGEYRTAQDDLIERLWAAPDGDTHAEEV